MALLNFLLIIHILGVVSWIGAAITMDLLRIKATISMDKKKILQVVEDNQWLGTRIFMPAGIVTLITGISQVLLNKGIDFTDLWILVALAGILVAIVHGSLVIAGLEQKLGKLNAKDKEFSDTYLHFVGATRTSLALLLVILADMVIKPTAENINFFIISTAFILIVIVLSHKKPSNT